MGDFANNIINFNGKVGIGTTSPGVKLDVRQAGSGVIGAISSTATDWNEFQVSNRSGASGAAVTAQVKVESGAVEIGSRTNNDLKLAAGDNGDHIVVKTNGNVGIGTTTPQRSLDLYSTGQMTFGNQVATDSQTGIYWNGGNEYGIYRTPGAWSGNYQQLKLAWRTGIILDPGAGRYGKSHVGVNGGVSIGSGYYSTKPANNSLIVEGNVGIGTATPSQKLQVNGNGIIGQSGSTMKIGHMGHGNWAGIAHTNRANGSDYALPQNTNGQTILNSKVDQLLRFRQGNSDKMVIRNGNVGIGTSNPGDTWKLAVNGKIRAKEVTVTNIGWSDFVFEESYALPTLEEVEAHIAEKGHLKDIPSAEEVEENGISLGETDARLLQKIEELTLYLIAQDKQIKALNEEVKTLKNK